MIKLDIIIPYSYILEKQVYLNLVQSQYFGIFRLMHLQVNISTCIWRRFLKSCDAPLIVLAGTVMGLKKTFNYGKSNLLIVCIRRESNELFNRIFCAAILYWLYIFGGVGCFGHAPIPLQDYCGRKLCQLYVIFINFWINSIFLLLRIL